MRAALCARPSDPPPQTGTATATGRLETPAPLGAALLPLGSRTERWARLEHQPARRI